LGHDFSVRIGRAALVAVVFVAVWSGVAWAGTPAAPIKVHLVLQQDRVLRGDSIKGTVVLTNTTSKRITVNTCAANGWLQVGLKGHGYAYAAVSTLIGCAPSVQLAPGPNQFPVTVLTKYEGCVQSGGGTITTQTPLCTPDGLPALPAGRYSTTLFIAGLSNLTQPPNRIVVRLK
jgi:hypothetical protein